MTDTAFDKVLESLHPTNNVQKSYDIIKVAKAVRGMWKDEAEQLTLEAELLAAALLHCKELVVDQDLYDHINDHCDRWHKYKDKK